MSHAAQPQQEHVERPVFQPMRRRDATQTGHAVNRRAAVVVGLPARRQRRHRDQPVASQSILKHCPITRLEDVQRLHDVRKEDEIGQGKEANLSRRNSPPKTTTLQNLPFRSALRKRSSRPSQAIIGRGSFSGQSATWSTGGLPARRRATTPREDAPLDTEGRGERKSAFRATERNPANGCLASARPSSLGFHDGNDTAEAKRHAAEVVRALSRCYPDAKCSLDFRTPLELLVATILSAQCTDERVNIVTPDVVSQVSGRRRITPPRRWRSWKRTFRAPAFFATRRRTSRPPARCSSSSTAGRFPRTSTNSCELPGVGRKTANVVLGTAFRYRVGSRRGHARRRASAGGWGYRARRTPRRSSRT